MSIGVVMIQQLQHYVPVFVLVAFRLAGMMIFAPLFGSAKVPKRLKAMFVLVLALGMTSSVSQPAELPSNEWDLAIGIAGELAFGLAMGTILSLVFIAVQWAGEIIGQQMGFNLSEVFDPQFGAQGSLIGDAYFMLTLVVFLIVGGHRAMIQGVQASFHILPLLSVGINHSMVDLLARLIESATVLAFRLAAPMLVTLMMTDLVLGLIGKTMPQMNVMAMGLNLRSAVGMIVIILGLTLTVRVMRDSVWESMLTMWNGWTGAVGS